MDTTHFTDIACMDSTPVVADKLSKTVRLLGFFIQNGVSKSKVMHDVVQKRGKNIGKAFFTCRPRDPHMSYVSPLEYQFSCSGSPPRPSRALAHVTRGTRNSNKVSSYPRHQKGARMCRGNVNDALVGHYIPIERRVKMTPTAGGSLLKEAEKEFHVDEAAEEFIERFYRELRLQKWLDHYC